MLKTKEYHICDRCKQVLEDKIEIAYDNLRMYELCNECYKDFNNFKQEVERLERDYEKIEKLYMFGKYLPKDDEKVDE